MKKKIKKTKKAKNEQQKTIIIAIMILVVVVLISGGTYSWWVWQSASANDTEVNITIAGLGDSDGQSRLKITGNNVTNGNTNNTNAPGIMPISSLNCDTSKYTLVGEATFEARNGTGTDMRVTPRLDINLTTAQGTLNTDAKSNLHWALVDITNTTTKTCKNPDYQGTFDKAAIVTITHANENADVSITGGSSLTAIGTTATINITNGTASSVLTFIATKESVTTKKYKIYVWLDGENDTEPDDGVGDGTPGYTYTNTGTTVSDPMQDLAISVKWSNKSTMIQE